MKSKILWHKGKKINQKMQRLCTANDPELDQQLIWYDCLGSLAQASMLKKLGIYNKIEAQRVSSELCRIARLASLGKLNIPVELEDSHTLIETILVSKLGSIGKKIHTGRSRNDQAATMVRLFMRHKVVKFIDRSFSILNLLESFYKKQSKISMPGYTHLQPAMPASVGMWVHSIYEATLRFAAQLSQYHTIINCCPLGAGAGFGSSFKLDRKHIAKLLHFDKVQRSFIDVNNSRGRLEEGFIQVLSGLAFIADKLASDLILFLTKEFALVKLDTSLKTGSSIMPQKNNPDLVELLRARAAQLRSTQIELTLIINKLSCSYHRDLQFTKEPLLRASLVADEIFESLEILLAGIYFDPKACSEKLYPELYATYMANRLVHEGWSFRDAYRQVAKSLESNVIKPEDFYKELSEPLKQTDIGFNQARKEAAKLYKKTRILAKKELACHKLLG